MKTSLFKWKPDLDGAAAEFAKAGNGASFSKHVGMALDMSF